MPGKIFSKILFFGSLKQLIRRLEPSTEPTLPTSMLPQGTAGKGKEERNNGIMAVARKKMEGRRSVVA